MDFIRTPYLLNVCNYYFADHYKSYRAKCHQTYKRLIEKGKNPLENKPSKVVRSADWAWMCTKLFNDPE